ncbi:hypothetical protein FACS189452_08350 [Bacteroidia bacterium]|nr:hypothetical protein FACS189452_08350 [Bacteroidia bacterium]GHT81631.1 hypothetical protein FACS189467_6040 [Bacteroidia bacterium]
MFFSLFGKPLLGFVFKQATKSAFGKPTDKKQKNKKQDSNTRSIIPDDVGNYVDFTEVKS